MHRFIKRFFCALLAAAVMAAGLTGAAYDEEARTPRKIVKAFDYGDDSKNAVQTNLYDESGLLTEVTLQMGEETDKIVFTYRFDEKGNPAGLSWEDGQTRYEAEIQNRYADGELIEAEVTDTLIDGESTRDDVLIITGPENMTVMACATASTALQCVRYFRGYRDTIVKANLSENRYEAGRLVKETQAMPGVFTEIALEYADDTLVESETRTDVAYDGETTVSSQITISDDAHYIVGYGETEDSAERTWKGVAYYKYGDTRTDKDTGEKYRSATIEHTEGTMGPVDCPYGIFAYLDEEGNVIRSELRFTSRRLIWYYEEGVLSARETHRIFGSNTVVQREEYLW